MVNQNKILSFKIKRRGKNVFPSDVSSIERHSTVPPYTTDVERTVDTSPDTVNRTCSYLE